MISRNDIALEYLEPIQRAQLIKFYPELEGGKMTLTKERKLDLEPRCFFCDKPVTEEDYCYGCGFYICQDCFNADNLPVGNHKISDHRR